MSNSGLVNGEPIIREFMQRTGAQYDTAWHYLTNTDWNIQTAISEYRRTDNSSGVNGQPVIYSSAIGGTTNRPSVPFAATSSGSQAAMRLPRTNLHDVENVQHPGMQRNAQPTSQPSGSASTLPRYGITYPPQSLPPLTEHNVVETSSSSTLQPLDIEGAPRLTRGMSRVSGNEPLVLKIRDINIKSVAEANQQDPGSDDEETKRLNKTSAHTFVLPNIYGSNYGEDQRAFLHYDLIETSTLVSLEQSGHLNWWADIGACRRLMPMVTSGDGNCLLHAASIAMWGFHDRQLGLRESLSRAMNTGSTSFKEGIKRRWRWCVSLTNRQIGLVYSEQEWEKEWGEMVNLASPKPRGESLLLDMSENNQSDKSPVMYESLEELHVFVLAHVLQRPIIVISKTMLYGAEGEAMCPIPFSGIYLPLERDPAECHRTPLLLTYDSSHFSALVPLEFDANFAQPGAHIPSDAIPLVNADLELLTIHYLIDPERNDFDIDEVLSRSPTDVEKLELLREYLDVVSAPIPVSTASDQGPHGVCVEGDGEGGMPDGGVSRFKAGHSRSDSEGSGFKSDSSGSGRGEGGALKKQKGLGKKEKNLALTEEQKYLDGRPDVYPKGKSSNPITSVAKSLGNMRHNLSKAVKGSGNGKMDHHRQRRPSMGAVTQSTRRVSQTVDGLPMTDSRRQVTCASLREWQLPDYWHEFIKNYLSSALQRFQEQQDTRRKQHDEIKRFTTERMQSGSLRPISLQVGSYPGGSGQWNDGRVPDVNEIAESRSRTLDVRGFARNSDVDSGRYSRTMAKGIGDGSRALAGTAGAQWVGTLPAQDMTLVTGNSKFYMTPAEDHCLSPNTENRLMMERSEQAREEKKLIDHGSTNKILVMPPSSNRAVFDARNKDLKQRGGGPMAIGATNTLPANAQRYPVGNKSSNQNLQVGKAIFYGSNSSRESPTYGTSNPHAPINQSRSVPISSNQRSSSPANYPAKFEATKSGADKVSTSHTAISEIDAKTQQLWLDKIAGSPRHGSNDGSGRSQMSSTLSSDGLKKISSGASGVPSSRSAGSHPDDSLASHSITRQYVAPPSGTVRQCRTSGCQFHGTSQQDFLCSACYRSSSYGTVANLHKSATNM